MSGDVEPVLIARIGKAHGLRGEVTVRSHTDDPAGRFAPGTVLATRAEAGSGVPRTLTVASARDHNGTWLIRFAEIPDRTGAEGLRGTHLLGPPAAPGDADGEGYYEEDLVGLAVRGLSGERIGEVVGLETGVAQDRLVVRLPDGVEALVPFVEAIVPTVDLDAGVVVLDPPPGLLDLARGS